jgi:hypothetical protein
MAGTTTKSKRTQRPGSDVNDLLIQFNKIMDDQQTRCVMAPAPVIKSGGSAIAKTGATATIVNVAGVLVNIAASTDLGALTGIDITAANFRIVLWGSDNAGTTTAFGGTEAATLAAATFPTVTAGQAAVAGAYITYASAFTGGTTPLDTATTVYFSTVGPSYSAFGAARVGNLAGTAISATV